MTLGIGEFRTMRTLADKRYGQIRKTELTEIVNSLHLHDLFSEKDGLHKGYGGLLVSSAIKRILQPKVLSGIRLSWGQILSTDGDSLSGEIDLMACVETPVRHWDIIDYTIERIECVRSVYEVKHSFPKESEIKRWGERLRELLSRDDLRQVPFIGIIVLWDEQSKNEDDFKQREEELKSFLPEFRITIDTSFILSGGEYDTRERTHNLESWDTLANQVESIKPPAYWSSKAYL